jgi:hypothetical protein
VRGGNGVIVLAPSIHKEEANGGLYRVVRGGEFPVLPDLIGDDLKDGKIGERCASDAEVKAFLAASIEGRRPGALASPLQTYIDETAGDGASRHATAIAAACWIAREGAAGYYDAEQAFAELRDLFGAASRRRRCGRDAATSSSSAASWTTWTSREASGRRMLIGTTTAGTAGVKTAANPVPPSPRPAKTTSGTPARS